MRVDLGDSLSGPGHSRFSFSLPININGWDEERESAHTIIIIISIAAWRVCALK